MKKLLMFSGLAMLIAFSVYSCNKMEAEPTNVDSINYTAALKGSQDDDAIILRVLELQDQLINQFQNTRLIEELAGQEELTETEAHQLAQAMGFKDLNEYTKFRDELQEAIENAQTLPYFEDEEEMTRRIQQLLERNYDGAENREGCLHCHLGYTLCTATVSHVAMIAHGSCAAAYPTILGGIACHAIVGIGQLGGYASCYFARNHCLNNCY